MPIETLFKFQQQAERRKPRSNPRVTPDPFLVISLPSGNHGIVLDLSPEGLGFLACEPVQEGQTLHFGISEKSKPAYQASGKVVWRDVSGKRAGLKFVHLTGEFRALIGRCLDGPHGLCAPVVETADTTLAPAAEESLPVVADNRGAWTVVANGITAVFACLIAAAIWLSVDQRDRIAALAYMNRAFLDVSGLTVLRHPPGFPTLSPNPSAAAPESADPPNASDVSGAFLPIEMPLPVEDVSLEAIPETETSNGDSSAPAAQSSAAPLPAPEIQPLAAAPPQDSGDVQLALARKLLRKSDDSKSLAKGRQLLWQAVEKGNTAAETELADLYLRGQGVEKNCSQARVLLTAAQNRNNEQARNRLKELSKYGCD